MSGGMYASVVQPCEGVNINTNDGDKFFGKWSLIQPTDFLMIQDRYQFQSHNDLNSDRGCGDQLFAQWSSVKPSDFFDES